MPVLRVDYFAIQATLFGVREVAKRSSTGTKRCTIDSLAFSAPGNFGADSYAVDESWLRMSRAELVTTALWAWLRNGAADGQYTCSNVSFAVV